MRVPRTPIRTFSAGVKTRWTWAADTAGTRGESRKPMPVAVLPSSTKMGGLLHWGS